MNEQDLKDFDVFKDIFLNEAVSLGIKYTLESDEKSDAEQKFIFTAARKDTPDDTITKNISCVVRTIQDQYFLIGVNYETGSVSFNIDLSEVTDRDFSKRLMMIQAATQVISEILFN